MTDLVKGYLKQVILRIPNKYQYPESLTEIFIQFLGYILFAPFAEPCSMLEQGFAYRVRTRIFNLLLLTKHKVFTQTVIVCDGNEEMNK